jgi:hypothetical protein
MGHRGGITALAVGFVVRLGLVVAFDLPVVPDLWVQALLLTLSAVMAILVAGAETGGTLVRIAGVAALVVAAGWVVRTWRRSGLA